MLPPRKQLPRREPLRLCKYKRDVYAERREGDDERVALEGSRVVFYKNGACQGVAYEHLVQDIYFPAGSLYTDASATGDAARPAVIDFNFGPNFSCAPEGVEFASRPWDEPTARAGAEQAQRQEDEEGQEGQGQGQGGGVTPATAPE